jgi:hypothetical protein
MKAVLVCVASALLLTAVESKAQTPPSNSNHWDIAKIDVSKLPPAADKADVTFDKDILPLFKASCVRCHGEQRPRGGFRADSAAGVLTGGRDGKMVVPGDSKKSLLVAAVAQIAPSITMPPKRRMRTGASTPQPPGGDNVPKASRPAGSQPSGQTGGQPSQGGPGGPGGPRQGPPAKPLTAAEVGLVRAWIDQGAK